jgi:hypothetical protein
MHPTLALSLAPFLPQDAGSSRHSVTLAEDATISLEARWEPFSRWSLGTREVVEHPLLTEVSPAEQRREVRGELLRPFLPPGPVAVGEAWEVDAEAVVPLLAQLHPGATAELSRPLQSTPGSHALLRAVSDRYVELLTRSHAAFQLDEDVRLNPAQFEGRLLLERASGRIVAYRLELPARDTNVDVNVQTAAPSKELPFGMTRIDIGFLPRMELAGGAWPADLEWTAAIDDAEARKRLRARFYGPIDWLPFAEAVERARAAHKPLFVVAVFGAFDDESC